ncbi:MAG: type I restriction endonuclease [Bacilli bacterium]
MDFKAKLKELGNRVVKLEKTIKTEEATKTSLIMPFFQLLGYDVFNPQEFTPEYIADVGIKKGEKVDYAIFLNDDITMLIEAKSITEKLDKHDSQLFRYFGTTKARFAILTNGKIYKFYTDLEKVNIMDSSPFLEIDITDLSDNDIQQLHKFRKENYDIDSILSTASNLKYIGLIKKVIRETIDNPSDEFIKALLNEGIYDGVKNKTVIEKFKPLIKRAINIYITDMVNAKLQNAINNNQEIIDDDLTKEDSSNIITTADELQAYYIVKAILSEYCNPDKIYYKDTASYFGVLFDNKTTKWICRFYFKENVQYITISDENKKEIRYDISCINDIYKYKDELINSLNKYEKVIIA